MPLYIVTLVAFVGALLAAYGLWLANCRPGVRGVLLLLGIASLVATLVLRMLEP